ncbi:ISAs1 family transposase [Lipingzhangella sp. LS1_29]|uniref:ISAs1 family transposase n=1 Tax=Lipingzhangella rawalii TaxID=2055835 RepID=A0ABU2H6D8_9ACTN|nr:ISAs1 family transposase [Lipingzhangella rawalii]MDS1270843.1 ISAs1 family transposase [Lipingzhangella rawalii]
MRLQSVTFVSVSTALSTPLPLPSGDCDPRDRRGRRHPLGCILLTALCAVVAGARCLEAIGPWAANAPQPTLARLGARTISPALGLRQAPSPATIRRVLTALDPAVLVGLAAAEDAAVLIVDGKSLRAAATANSGPAHLLAAMTDQGRIAAHVRVGDTTSEIAAVAELLANIDITGCVISADALHAQKATAEYLAKRGADYLLTLKANQPTLFAQAKALPWAQAPVLERCRERAHGREEVRTATVLTAPAIAFPNAAQVVRIHRWVRTIATGRVRRSYAYLVTSLPANRATAQRLAHLVRGHWRIEARHHIRDVSFGEDASRVRTGAAPQNMALLRAIAIGLLAGLGFPSIPTAYRWVGYDCFTRPLDLLGLA